ncbi:MAG: hypothetical protein ACTSPY_06540 [Candidatus Helarchaeota archaeon]
MKKSLQIFYSIQIIVILCSIMLIKPVNAFLVNKYVKNDGQISYQIFDQETDIQINAGYNVEKAASEVSVFYTDQAGRYVMTQFSSHNFGCSIFYIIYPSTNEIKSEFQWVDNYTIAPKTPKIYATAYNLTYETMQVIDAYYTYEGQTETINWGFEFFGIPFYNKNRAFLFNINTKYLYHATKITNSTLIKLDINYDISNISIKFNDTEINQDKYFSFYMICNYDICYIVGDVSNINNHIPFDTEGDNSSTFFTKDGISASKVSLSMHYYKEYKNGEKEYSETLRLIGTPGGSIYPLGILFTNLSYGNISKILYDPEIDFFGLKTYICVIAFLVFSGIFIVATIALIRKPKDEKEVNSEDGNE